MNPIILIVGTRPEGIKMAPLYFALKQANLPVIFCSTSQHTNLLSEVYQIFNFAPDIELYVMEHNQDLFHITNQVLQKTKLVYEQLQPQLVLVHGDTTTTMAAALSAFYSNIPIGHIEAGLRTYNIHNPFPEEMNRRSVGTIASYNFAPTTQAVNNLREERVAESSIFYTGNTIVDALRIVREKIANKQLTIEPTIQACIKTAQSKSQQIVLITAHRRESFNGGIERILTTVKNFALKNPDVFFIYPYHPNPHIVRVIEQLDFSRIHNIFISTPLLYKDLVYVLLHADWLATDSGGIQEEAISLGKRVIVFRDYTERPEGIWEGLATLVGTDCTKIRLAFEQEKKEVHRTTIVPNHTYGDGYAADKIVGIIQKIVFEKARSQMNRVCIMGLGYIGLPTAIVAAENNYLVIGFDIDTKRVERINNHDPVIQEPEIFDRLGNVLSNKTFRAITTMESADYFIIAVPTPFKEEKKADLSCVWQAADLIIPVLQAGNVVILESTIPVGTTDTLAHYIAHKSGLEAGKDFFVAHCPERVLPGNIFYELVHNNRIIGGINQISTEHASTFYKKCIKGELHTTSARAAELVKLVENSSRDVAIAFANEVANMAYATNLNPFEIIELANRHPRVSILQPSCGVGGHCIAVDPWFLVETFPQCTQLIKAARNVNDAKPHAVVQTINACIDKKQQESAQPITVLVLGLTYKPNVDDIRESPAVTITQTLAQRADIRLLICEPHVPAEKMPQFEGATLVSFAQGIQQATIIVCLVKHSVFKTLACELLSEKIILDFCGLLYKSGTQSEKHTLLFWPASNDHTALQSC